MSAMQDEFNQLISRLKVQRDELRVKSHLLKLDLQDEWAAMERKWEQLNEKLQRAEKEGAEAGREIGAAAKLLGEEIKAGYERVSKQLKG
jgi:predicted  nucleic acid-binding Zn-ribbon protein